MENITLTINQIETEGRRDPGPWWGACGKGDTGGEEAPGAAQRVIH